MREQATPLGADFFTTSDDDSIPGRVRSLIGDSFAKPQRTLLQINWAAKDGTQALEVAMVIICAGARAITEKLLLNAEANTKAIFDAAQSISRANSVEEVTRLQTRYFQTQFVSIYVQTKEIRELTSKVVEQVFEATRLASYKVFDDMTTTG